jgi:hypothetical protein
LSQSSRSGAEEEVEEEEAAAAAAAAAVAVVVAAAAAEEEEEEDEIENLDTRVGTDPRGGQIGDTNGASVLGPRAYMETTVDTADGIAFSYAYALRDLHRDLVAVQPRPEPWYYREPPRLPLYSDRYYCKRGTVARSRR